MTRPQPPTSPDPEPYGNVKYPKAGRYRLFRYASDRRQLLRCRACRRTVKREGQWRHLATEIRRFGSEEALAARLKFLARARKSRRNLAHSRFEFSIGRKRDWKAMDREDRPAGWRKGEKVDIVKRSDDGRQ